MKIYFARHGESQANILKVISNRKLLHNLTPKGRKQARNLADTLQNHPITHVFASSVPRAVETGAIVAHQLGLECVATEALREFDCGICEGRSDEAAWQRWQLLFDAWYRQQRYDDCIDGGETFHDVWNRFVPFIDDLVKKFGNTSAEILCISHGGVYCLMLPLVVKNINHGLIKTYGFDYATCIVTELQADGLTCVEWNGHPVTTNPPPG